MVMAMWLTPGAHACRMHRSVTPPGAAMSLTTGGCRPGPVKVVLEARTLTTSADQQSWS